MKADKIRQVDTAELQGQLKEARENMFRLRFQIGMGQTDGVKKYRQTRKDLARVLTVLREREIEANKKG